MNYYRRYLGDYMRDTAHLSLAEHGAYTILLDTQYATEKALPSDLDALNRLCRAMTSVERAAVRTVAEQFFPIAGDGRVNPRAGRELEKGANAIAQTRAAGNESARKPCVPIWSETPSPW